MPPKKVTVKIKQGDAWWCQFASLLSIAASNKNALGYLEKTAKLDVSYSLTDNKNIQFRRWLAKVFDISDLPTTPGGSYSAIDKYFSKLLKKLGREYLKPTNESYVSVVNRSSLQLSELPMLLQSVTSYVMFKFKDVCDDTSRGSRHFCVYSDKNHLLGSERQ